ncbi:MAG: transposase [Alphaproteobacteria bacterium]|nr:transposase [Alphaproteobacteria bacterium]
MARTARLVIPDTPHHICQRAQRDDFIFNDKEDFETYTAFLKEQCDKQGVGIWAYALLPNQIHLIAVPRHEHSLADAIGEAHRRYTLYMNDRENLVGHLFQNRFYSYPMDESSLLSAARMMERLPVLSGIAPTPESYLWSSCRAHCKGRDDRLMQDRVIPFLKPDWAGFVQEWPHPQELTMIQTHLHTGRPRGSDDFLNAIEKTTGRTVRPQKRGRKPKITTEIKAA